MDRSGRRYAAQTCSKAVALPVLAWTSRYLRDLLKHDENLSAARAPFRPGALLLAASDGGPPVVLLKASSARARRGSKPPRPGSA